MRFLQSIIRRLSDRQLRLAVHSCGLAIVAVIAATGYVTSFAATEDQEDAWQQSIAHDENLLQQQETILFDRENTECELFAMSRRLEELTAMIPNEPEESRFLAQLSALADESQLSIQNFRPGPPEDTHNVKRIRVQLSGAGSYECICTFMDGLQALPRLTHVSRLTIDPVDSSGMYPVQLELSIFFAADGNQDQTRIAQNG